jgi:hypothetical protein
MPSTPTSQATMGSAEICRQENWPVGSTLLGSVSFRGMVRQVRIRITAIGRKLILAELISIDGAVVEGIYDEVVYDLHSCDWRRVA